ncbi:hypothetical protein EZS27_022461 [termite gut metagenome]|jgi:uncharacterized alpha-E superfamily protein|uniref:DUF403 domain-containing protein n=1 Tax=termite gut metagenome TaxID=433724 RepID=A0A5J4R424_9ZZZZ|nr:alpha-E domain-containing protein [Mediterranea sp.]
MSETNLKAKVESLFWLGRYAQGETISKAKAENLFWLGRYTQRVYIILHFLRKYRDRMIDEDENAYSLFCGKLGIENIYTSREDFLHRYLFDQSNNNSLISKLAYASNNATILREEIKSETFAYIQMSICHIERCAGDSDLSALQPVTDSLLAFWGSVDERIHNRDVRNMIKAGKYLETFDLYARFDYPYGRIIYLLNRLEKHIEKEKSIFDQNLFLEIKSEVEHAGDGYNKAKVLSKLNQLFIV